MKVSVEINHDHYRVNLQQSHCLAIPLTFNAQQPNHFSAPHAMSRPLAVDGFIGDTQQGGSCNVAEIRMVPHCNGTHTETIQHIVNQSMGVHETLTDALIPATLISVVPCFGSATTDVYQPAKAPTDLMITAAMLRDELGYVDADWLTALIIRTFPNPVIKQQQVYDTVCQPAFFSIEAMAYLIERNISHLLVDIPSVDRMHDEGQLHIHHLFWNVTAGSHETSAAAQRHKTITEMIYVAEDIVDGRYLLNLQIPAFMSDAAPSRPILYKLEPA